MDNSNKLFSIVIVNYNHAKYLEQAIKSILNQDFTDYELIIIDGGSKDNSVEIIKKYEDSIAYWISEPDKGQSDAFNKGFKKAQGQFGFWLNADDILLSGSLTKIADYIYKYPKYSWFAGNTIFFNKNNQVIRCSAGPEWKDFLIQNSTIYVYGPSTIFNIKLLNEVGGFDLSLHYSMDTDLWMKFVNKGYKFKRIKHYIWGFRIHEDSKTSHTLTDKPSEAFLNEGNMLLRRNNWRLSPLKARIQTIYKIFSGLYLRSYFDSKKYKQKNINEVI